MMLRDSNIGSLTKSLPRLFLMGGLQGYSLRAKCHRAKRARLLQKRRANRCHGMIAFSLLLRPLAFQTTLTKGISNQNRFISQLFSPVREDSNRSLFQKGSPPLNFAHVACKSSANVQDGLTQYMPKALPSVFCELTVISRSWEPPLAHTCPDHQWHWEGIRISFRFANLGSG